MLIVHFIFIGVAVVTAIMQIVKHCIIQRQKRIRSQNKPCKYLAPDEFDKMLTCTSGDFHDYFNKNEKSCNGCKGRIIELDHVILEHEILYKHNWESIALTVANTFKLILPYLPFLYTLLISLLKNMSVNTT